MRRTSHGMTLVETLVVLAIAGLIIAVLLAILLPSDDRKCKLEAERLAAFLTAASAESVMRDAPVRVVFDLDRGTAVRQFARVGADITAAIWEEDENVDPYTVSTPVRFDTVDSAESPNQAGGGNGYLIFRGERTEGAVVVLGLEQIFYSVLVPPNGAEIHVEKGRQGRPSGASPINRDLDPFANGIDTGGAVAGNLPSGGLGGVSANGLNLGGAPAQNRAANAKPANRASTPPVDPGTSPPSPTSPPPVTPAPVIPSGGDKVPTTPNPPIEPTPDPVPEQPANGLGTACVTDLDCGPPDGWAACDLAFGVCGLDPVGRALRMTDMAVIQPQDQQIRNIVQSVMQAEIGLGRLHLLTYFDSGKVWLVQGQRAGELQTQNDSVIKQYRQVGSFPSYPGEELADGGYTCTADRVCTASFDLAEQDVEIYIQKSSNPPANVCNYNTLSLRVSVEVRVRISSDLATTVTGVDEAGARNSYIRLTALLLSEPARNIVVNGRTLYELLQDNLPLDSAGEDIVADANGDGQPDAWRFVFEGSAEAVALVAPPFEDPNARPENCGVN